MQRNAVEKVETTKQGTRFIYRNGSRFIAWWEMQEIAAVKQPPSASGSSALAYEAPILR